MRQVPHTTAVKLMAAADLIADRGLDGTKIEDFSSATGIPKATLYYYFDGKEEILSYIFGVVLDELGVAVGLGLAGEGSAATRLARVIESHLAVFERYPKASQALYFDLGRAVRRPELAARIRSSYVDPVSTLLSEGASDGSLRRVEDASLSAVAVLGATCTAAIHVLAIDPAVSIKGVSKVIVPFVLRGLESKAYEV
jgi:TetR/AcrR family transcriptional regulator